LRKATKFRANTAAESGWHTGGPGVKTSDALRRRLSEVVQRRSERLVEITRTLVQTPSENTPPTGAEAACQSWIAGQLTACGLKPDVYYLDQIDGLSKHPLFFAGRDYAERPNVAARREGTGGGRSLILSGHIDTVPRGTQDWSADPFSGEVHGNRLYGRGSNDMKAGVATNLFVMECLAELQLPLQGDVIYESIVDEEFGGCNGTLGGRLRGYRADAAVISEPSSLRICPAQRGGRTAHITFRNASGGVLQGGAFPAGITPQLTRFLESVPRFAAGRRAGARAHEMYAGHADPVPVSVTKVFTAPWGTREPMTLPDSARVELYWQLMPGETQAEVDREFFDWMDETVRASPDVFSAKPEVEFPIRWMPGSAIAASEPVVQELAACGAAVLGATPKIAGIEGPCDLFVFHEFGIPAVLWGASGANTHAADEYVEIDSMIRAAETLLVFVAEWCGAAEA
jgi:acetylornithine deacetylase